VNNLEQQLYAARGFSSWLSQQPSDDLNSGMLHVFDVYQREIERQISGSGVSEDILGILTLASLEATFRRDELLDMNPALAAYNPDDDPRDVEEMRVRLLSDAAKLFGATVDGRVYLSLPSVAEEISDFVQRVLNHF
jgi:hypothetical protein